MKKNIMYFFLISVFILLSCSFTFAETLTITTYYPSPYGVYNTLRLYPTTRPATCQEGDLYYDSGVKGLYMCKTTGTPGVWQTIVGASASLDAAYNYGGPGAGRIITADSGPVEIKDGGDGSGATVLRLTTSTSASHPAPLILTSGTNSQITFIKNTNTIPHTFSDASDVGFRFWDGVDNAAINGDTGVILEMTPKKLPFGGGHVGIGTDNNPEFKLTLKEAWDGGISDGGILAVGTFGDGVNLITSGGGTRLIWYPKKAAFRAGGVIGSQWDNANIGSYSTAFGGNSEARGTSSFAAGQNTLARGVGSVALGTDAVAYDDGSFMWNSGSYPASFTGRGPDTFNVYSTGGIHFEHDLSMHNNSKVRYYNAANNDSGVAAIIVSSPNGKTCSTRCNDIGKTCFGGRDANVGLANWGSCATNYGAGNLCICY